MKRFIGVRLMFLIFVFITFNSLEAAGVKSHIIGKWVEEGGNGQYEFLSDGTVVSVKGKQYAAGAYKIIGENRIKMDFGPNGMSLFELSINPKDGKMTLKDPIGKVSRFNNKTLFEARRKTERAKRKEEAKRKIEIAAADEKLKPRFVFSDLTALDLKTKLMWTRDGYLAGKKLNWDDADNFVKQLNKKKYAGFSDWRLPTEKDFTTLGLYAKDKGIKAELPFLFSRIGFENMPTDSEGYWLSSPCECTAMGRAGQYLGDNGSYTTSKNNPNDMWPVRSEK